jgi:hypothetical protein
VRASGRLPESVKPGASCRPAAPQDEVHAPGAAQSHQRALHQQRHNKRWQRTRALFSTATTTAKAGLSPGTAACARRMRSRPTLACLPHAQASRGDPAACLLLDCPPCLPALPAWRSSKQQYQVQQPQQHMPAHAAYPN